jgi:hypothetical protein
MNRTIYSTKIEILLSYKEADMINAKKLSSLFFVATFLLSVWASGSFAAESAQKGTTLSPKASAEIFIPPKMVTEAKVISKKKEFIKAQAMPLKFADLVLSSITSDKTSVASNEAITITATVTNASTVPSPACLLCYIVTRMATQQPYQYFANIPALGNGESVTLEATFSFYFTGGYTVKACADAQGVVTELNKNNNCKQLPTPIVIHK